MSGIRGVMLLGGGIPCPQISGSCRLTQFIRIWVSNLICSIKAVGFFSQKIRAKNFFQRLQLFHLPPPFLNRRLCLFSRHLQCFRIHLSKKSWTPFKHCCRTIINVIFLISVSVSDGISVIFEQRVRVFQGWALTVTSMQRSLQHQHGCTALSWTDAVLQQLTHQYCLQKVSFNATFYATANQIWINKRLVRLHFLTGSLWNISVIVVLPAKTCFCADRWCFCVWVCLF